jgi:hypothetical protein
MYSGSTLTRLSGNIIGAHQKIDRIARRQLEILLPGVNFPDITSILNFEGDQGPDGIKRKSPGANEEWHFIRPFDKKDTKLIDFIDYHYKELVKALKSANSERTAFEAAWLAHAIVDGLTPAHHYPYEQELMELRNGEGNETRSTLKKKLILPGETRSHAIKNNWKMWGPKGLFTTHAAFEMGFATLIAPLGFNDLALDSEYISAITKKKVGPWFRSMAQQVAKLNIYDTFYKTGWTLKLSNQVKKELAPTLINAVTTVWYCAYQEATKSERSHFKLIPKFK